MKRLLGTILVVGFALAICLGIALWWSHVDSTSIAPVVHSQW